MALSDEWFVTRILHRERMRGRREVVPLRIKDTARRLGRALGHASVRVSWGLGRWWTHLPKRPMPELATLWKDVRWSRRRQRVG